MSDSGTRQSRMDSLNLQLMLGEKQYGLAEEALGGGMKYLMGARSLGGGIDQTGKFDTMGTDVMEASGRAVRAGGGPFGAGSVASALGAGAAGLTATETQRGSAALDEINKIRSALAGHGLVSTGLAGQAGALQAEAFRLMPPSFDYLGAGLGAIAATKGLWGRTTPVQNPQFTFGPGGAGTPSSMSSWATQPITSLVQPGYFSLGGNP